MTAAMVIRLVLLMTVMPGSCYADAVTALVGGLPLVPWHRRRVGPPAGGPAPAVACTWRDAAGPAPPEERNTISICHLWPCSLAISRAGNSSWSSSVARTRAEVALRRPSGPGHDTPAPRSSTWPAP
jgi:hypothetical protein